METKNTDNIFDEESIFDQNNSNKINSNQNTNDKNNSLEEKVGFFGRLKYFILPAAFTVGTYFIPEIKEKYANLSPKKQDEYSKITFIGTGVAGIALAGFSGYELYKRYRLQNKNKKDKKTEYILK